MVTCRVSPLPNAAVGGQGGGRGRVAQAGVHAKGWGPVPAPPGRGPLRGRGGGAGGARRSTSNHMDTPARPPQAPAGPAGRTRARPAAPQRASPRRRTPPRPRGRRGARGAAVGLGLRSPPPSPSPAEAKAAAQGRGGSIRRRSPPGRGPRPAGPPAHDRRGLTRGLGRAQLPDEPVVVRLAQHLAQRHHEAGVDAVRRRAHRALVLVHPGGVPPRTRRPPGAAGRPAPAALGGRRASAGRRRRWPPVRPPAAAGREASTTGIAAVAGSVPSARVTARPSSPGSCPSRTTRSGRFRRTSARRGACKRKAQAQPAWAGNG